MGGGATHRLLHIMKQCVIIRPKEWGFMRTNLEQARHLLETGGYTCVFYKADQAITKLLIAKHEQNEKN